MKLKIAISVILTVILIFSCNKSTTEPTDEPVGYQKDIPWPSLADSPWPMYRCDPQNTCRTKYIQNVNGIVYKIYLDSMSFNSGITADAEGSLYFIYQDLLKNSAATSMTNDGIINWKYYFNSTNMDNPVPLLQKNGTIYYFSPYTKKLFALGKDGKKEWQFDSVDVTLAGINISKDGTLYFINYVGSATIYAVKNGILQWKYGDNNLRGSEGLSISLSPDGKTLYVPGKIDVAALIAFDLETKSIKWSFGKKRMINPAVVDAFGNIYFITNLNDNELSLYCLNESGKILWNYALNVNWNNADVGNTMVSIDKNGNLLFGNDTLTSLNYRGKLNWKFAIPEGCKVLDHITIDGQNNIIFKDTGNRLFILDETGKQIHKILLPSSIKSGYPCVIDAEGMIHIVSWRDKKLITIK